MGLFSVGVQTCYDGWLILRIHINMILSGYIRNLLSVFDPYI